VGNHLIPEGYWCETTKAYQMLKLQVLELRVKSESRRNVGHADTRRSARGYRNSGRFEDCPGDTYRNRISEMKYFYVLGRAPVPRPVLVSSYLEFRQSKRREMLRPLRSTGR